MLKYRIRYMLLYYDSMLGHGNISWDVDHEEETEALLKFYTDINKYKTTPADSSYNVFLNYIGKCYV